MKKNLFTLIALIFISLSIPSFAGTEVEKFPTEQEIIVRNQKLTDRLEEINSIDKTKLSREEKRALRKEVKEIQKTMDIGGGVYISVGALILIIILLIILL